MNTENKGVQTQIKKIADDIRETYQGINFSIYFQSNSPYKNGFGVSSMDYIGTRLNQYTNTMIDQNTVPDKTEVGAFCLLQKAKNGRLAVAINYDNDYCQSAIIVREIVQKLVK